MIKEFVYDLAISFAGEDRVLAKFLATSLSEEYRVFFDEYEKADLWGSDLSSALPGRYVSARYCLVLQSQEYLEKAWTTLERQAIIFEFLKRRGTNYVLPVNVRGFTGNIPGLSHLIGYRTISGQSDWDNLLNLLKEKLSDHS